MNTSGEVVLVPQNESDELCTCPCHDPKTRAMHIMACCYVCPKCNKNIKFNAFDNHITNCTGVNQK